MTFSTTRRTFLAAAAASRARILGANDRVRCGTIGTGGRGQLLTARFQEMGAEMAAVCDVYEPRVRAGLKQASPGARGYSDYRRLLEDKSLDAVIIATPDHLHATHAVAAAGSGKDIYLEKPMAKGIEEGFRIVEAVRRAKRVAQVGTQRRSYDLYREARQIMESGATGEIRLVNAWWVNHQRSLRPAALEGKLDWDLFLGPAPKVPLDPARYFNWLYFRDYAGGMLSGQGAHIVDGIHWMMNSTYPLAVTAAGNRPNIDGAENTETATMSVEYPENYLLVFTVGYKAMRYNLFNDQIQQFHGSAARFDLGREAYSLWPQSSAIEMKPSREKRSPGTFDAATTAHVRNFLECVKTRQDPNATVEMGQSAVIVLAMAIESLRTGRRMVWDAAARRAK
ncbi:MAG TPA: Gfo/Idh/MocA family oxidoreductase [Bryobacteraceae bacterium]|nr:Gfo/Idh/MocA family oxidoreductase [Bryobacteraceae bacterium]